MDLFVRSVRRHRVRGARDAVRPGHWAKLGFQPIGRTPIYALSPEHARPEQGNVWDDICGFGPPRRRCCRGVLSNGPARLHEKGAHIDLAYRLALRAVIDVTSYETWIPSQVLPRLDSVGATGSNGSCAPDQRRTELLVRWPRSVLATVAGRGRSYATWGLGRGARGVTPGSAQSWRRW
jgi:hypothetical protein